MTGFENESSTSYTSNYNISYTDIIYDVRSIKSEYDPEVPITKCRFCSHCRIYFNRKNRYCPECGEDSFSKLEKLISYLESKDSHKTIDHVHAFQAVPVKKVKKIDREGKQLFEILEEITNENRKNFTRAIN